ncbi:MAG: pyridoxine 5'-phosphate synthase [Candidatus Omnitrophica bacterium 4484_70.1]|nr:MAG: pyridoxine 5'-phosphate synthase [Candidatus Omnitrophica bacterium 4484_70.1]
MRLGVNIDHVATLREVRKTFYPDPVLAALLCEYAKVDSIVAHLREDRRHIKERDLILIKRTVKIPLNLEMSTNKDIVDFAIKIKPYKATLVPERRKELTTEGGLNLRDEKIYEKVKKVVERLQKEGIKVSLFIDPLLSAIKKSKKLGVEEVEINTGRYSEAEKKKRKKEWMKVKEACISAKKLGLGVAAGHGLNYDNVREIVKIKEIEELNIGHAIIAYSVFVGIVPAVKEMFKLIKKR